jgi:hypothetical protein
MCEVNGFGSLPHACGVRRKSLRRLSYHFKVAAVEVFLVYTYVCV